MKKVIYTAIFNNYDTIKHHGYRNDDFEYVVFMDETTYQQQRKIIPAYYNVEVLLGERTTQEFFMQSKEIKLRPHIYLGKHQASIYIDGSIKQIDDANKFFDPNQPFKITNHPRRNCIYKEADICAKQRLGKLSAIQRQIERYKSEKYPENNGLFMGGIISRVHNDHSQSINEAWWNEVKNGTTRDQISLPYVNWKLSANIASVDYENDIDKVFKVNLHQ